VFGSASCHRLYAIRYQLSAIGSLILGRGRRGYAFRERLPTSVVNRIDFSFRSR
jgi:hypothetical protein